MELNTGVALCSAGSGLVVSEAEIASPALGELVCAFDRRFGQDAVCGAVSACGAFCRIYLPDRPPGCYASRGADRQDAQARDAYSARGGPQKASPRQVVLFVTHCLVVSGRRGLREDRIARAVCTIGRGSACRIGLRRTFGQAELRRQRGRQERRCVPDRG